MAALSNGLAGVTGEYYVCSELSHRGYLTTLTLKNAEGIDILATRPKSGRAILIQVKTTQGKDGKWLLSKKNEKFKGDNFFYVFVCLGDVGQRPSFHIVPSSEVADRITKGHAKWLAGQKRDGTQRKDTSMRAFKNRGNNDFLERWELLDGAPNIPTSRPRTSIVASRSIGASPCASC